MHRSDIDRPYVDSFTLIVGTANAVDRLSDRLELLHLVKPFRNRADRSTRNELAAPAYARRSIPSPQITIFFRDRLSA